MIPGIKAQRNGLILLKYRSMVDRVMCIGETHLFILMWSVRKMKKWIIVILMKRFP